MICDILPVSSTRILPKVPGRVHRFKHATIVVTRLNISRQLSASTSRQLTASTSRQLSASTSRQLGASTSPLYGSDTDTQCVGAFVLIPFDGVRSTVIATIIQP